MNIEHKLTSIILTFFISSLPAFSQKESFQINWDCLNLSPNQTEKIQVIDSSWRKKSSKILPRLHSYQEQLQEELSNPKADEKEIMELQKKVFIERQKLQEEALENFLSKKRILNNYQKEKLNKIIR
jgi:Spy/CpxP family protein refolding chaperone